MLLHHKFIDSAKTYGPKEFIIDKTTNQRVTYSRALIASLLLAEKFKRYDEGFIGIMVPTSAGCMLSILGSLMSGRTPVMINYSTGAEQNCLYAQSKCDFTTIITSRALLERIQCPVVPGMVMLEDIMKQVTFMEKIQAAVKSKFSASIIKRMVAGGDENDNIVILFTSGSEKDPKAVQLSHKNINANIESLTQLFNFYSKDIFLGNLPLFHVFGQTAHMWVPMYFGMSIITYANPLDFKMICDIVRTEKVSIMAGTPSFFWGYLAKSSPGDFESCRLMICGADKCPDALRKGYLERHNKIVLEAYGTTETSPGLCINTTEHNRPGSVGRPLPGVTVRIENYETGEVCSTGQTGKILVKGDNVMKGYFDDFEQTSLAFRHGFYDTGDMGWMDEDGFLWHVGRLKRFVKVGGEMVSLIKVEDTLEKLLPDNTQCCVVEVPDHVKGSKIIATVTRPVDEKEIVKKMGASLPNIALPKQFVVIPELPHMASGKIDFRSVTEMVRSMIHKQ